MRPEFEALLEAIAEAIKNGIILPFEIEQAYFNVVNGKE